MKPKDLVEVIDKRFFSSKSNKRALKFITDNFFNIYDDKEFSENDVILIRSIYDQAITKIEKSKMDLEDKRFMIMMIGVYFGILLGRFSKKINLSE